MTLIALAFKVGCVVYLFSLALLTVLFLVISVPVHKVLAVKSMDCSSEGPQFKSQQPHGGLQPSAMRSDAFFLGYLKTAAVHLCIIINKSLVEMKKS